MADDEEIWQRLYHQLRAYFSARGVESEEADGDFFVVTEKFDRSVSAVFFFNVDLLSLPAIAFARQLLAGHSGWTIEFLVYAAEWEPGKPPMGVTIREHEIIDGLRREFLPERFRSFEIPDSRPETERD